jgi:hypothetical protein
MISPNKRSLEQTTIMDLASPVQSPTKKRRKTQRRLMKHLMNFRTNRGCAEFRTMPDGSKRVVNSQKPGSPYSMTWMMPMARVKYARLNEGGDENEKKKYLEGKTPEGRVPREQAKLSCVVVLGGLVDHVHQEQQEFVACMLDKFDELLPLMWQNTRMRKKYEDKAKRLMKNKTPEEQAKKAFALFYNDVRLPFRRGDEITQFNVDNSAFRRDGTAVVPTFFSAQNQIIEEVEKIRDGAVLELGVSLNIYETPAGMVGIKFRWDSRNNVLWKNGTGRTGPSETELLWNQKQATFIERDGNVYANNSTGGRFMLRTADLTYLYAPASNEGRTMNNITIEAKDAKYGATAEETSETKDFFDHMHEINMSALRFMFDAPNILKEQTVAQIDEAKVAAEEGGLDQTIEELAFENFVAEAKLPIQPKNSADSMNPLRIMKFTQRTSYPSGDEITFTIVDTEGNDADEEGNQYTMEHLSRGDKLSHVITVAPWISPSGDAYGVSYKMSPHYPIHIAEKSSSAAANNDLSYGRDMSFLDSI